jgi:RimJ/RimL family protein N-acetyltransferase
MLRLDHIDDLIDEISILVDPNEQGKGFALSALKALETLALTKTIEAFVREDNIASHKLFQRAKFKKISATKYCLFPNPPKKVTNNHAR